MVRIQWSVYSGQSTHTMMPLGGGGGGGGGHIEQLHDIHLLT